MKDSKLIAIAGSDRVPLPGAKAVGAADPEAWIEVTLKLKRQNPLPTVEGRPARTYTREEFAAQFGASPAAITSVANTFADYGLTVVRSDPATRSLRLGGPVSAMEEAFGVRLIHYKTDSGDYRGRIGKLHVPSAVADQVEAVFGLDNRRAVRRRPGHPQRQPLSATAHKTNPKTRPWYFPAELATAYDFPAGDGTDQTVGLIEFGGGFFASDLASFVQQANLPTTPTVVAISVDNTPTNSQDEAVGEVMLDIEVIAGICPKATIPVYFGQFTEQGWIDVLDAAVHDSVHKPQVLSISWGYAEDVSIWTQSAVDQVNQALQEAALLGLTVCVASGDDGSSDGVTDGHAHVDFPCASPYVLAVGGTLLRTHGKRSEKAWKDGDGLRADNGGSTGGGVSARLARPSWQGGLDIAPVNPGQMAGRIVPDVAADASPNSGYFTVAAGQAGVVGGTSAAAPLWAALVTRMNQQLARSDKRIGYLTPLLYGPGSDGKTPLGKQQGFNDITSGNNDTATVGGFSCHAGFDAVTGWGSPKGNDLLAALTKLV